MATGWKLCRKEISKQSKQVEQIWLGLFFFLAILRIAFTMILLYYYTWCKNRTNIVDYQRKGE